MYPSIRTYIYSCKRSCMWRSGTSRYESKMFQTQTSLSKPRERPWRLSDSWEHIIDRRERRRHSHAPFARKTSDCIHRKFEACVRESEDSNFTFGIYTYAHTCILVGCTIKPGILEQKISRSEPIIRTKTHSGSSDETLWCLAITVALVPLDHCYPCNHSVSISFFEGCADDDSFYCFKK